MFRKGFVYYYSEINNELDIDSVSYEDNLPVDIYAFDDSSRCYHFVFSGLDLFCCRLYTYVNSYRRY